ncbi:MAG: UbiD family decarboxylase [bacterium]|nr:UbiD family decarboxylase [bacterium]
MSMLIHVNAGCAKQLNHVFLRLTCTRFLIVVDADINVRDWADVVWRRPAVADDGHFGVHAAD